MIGWIFAVLSVVVLLGWVERRRRIRRTIRGDRPLVGDDQLRQIMRDGRVEVDDPGELDEEEIRRAEDRFWDESAWDDPEEFRP